MSESRPREHQSTPSASGLCVSCRDDVFGELFAVRRNDAESKRLNAVPVRSAFTLSNLPAMIESLNSSLRKLVYHRGHFPSDEAATKLLYLALRNIMGAWIKPTREWKAALAQFAILFPERLAAVA